MVRKRVNTYGHLFKSSDYNCSSQYCWMKMRPHSPNNSSTLIIAVFSNQILVPPHLCNVELYKASSWDSLHIQFGVITPDDSLAAFAQMHTNARANIGCHHGLDAVAILQQVAWVAAAAKRLASQMHQQLCMHRHERGAGLHGQQLYTCKSLVAA